MIYIEKLPFRPGSDEWIKMALFMNARLLLIFEEELAYRGIDKLDASLIEDEELFHKFSDYYTPMIFSYAKANQAVIATYLLIKEQGFYEGDIDVYFVLHMLMRSYRKRLREMMGNTVLKICDEERVEYEKLFEGCKVTFTNNKDKVSYFEDVDNYENMLSSGYCSGFKLYPDDEIMNIEVISFIFSGMRADLNLMYKEQFTGEWIYLDKFFGKKWLR